MTGPDCGIATPDYRLPTTDPWLGCRSSFGLGTRCLSINNILLRWLWLSARDCGSDNQNLFWAHFRFVAMVILQSRPTPLLSTLFCSLSLIFCCSANAYLAHVSSNPLAPLSLFLSLSRFSSRMKIVHFVCRKAGAPIKIYIIPSCTFIAVS